MGRVCVSYHSERAERKSGKRKERRYKREREGLRREKSKIE